jgi:hypothetical protein
MHEIQIPRRILQHGMRDMTSQHFSLQHVSRSFRHTYKQKDYNEMIANSI